MASLFQLNQSTKQFISCLLIIVFSVGSVFTQQLNPFDVLSDEEYERIIDSMMQAAVEADTLIEVDTIAAEIVEEPTAPPVIDEDIVALSDWFLLGYTFVLILLVSLIFSIGRNEVEKSWRSFFNQNALNNLYKEKIEFKYTVYLLLYLLYFLVMGLWIYRLVLHFEFSPFTHHGILLLGSLGVIVGLILSKHFILWIISSIFPIEKSLTKYNFLIVIFNQLIAIALLPLLIVHLFAPENISYYALMTAVFLIGFIYLVRSFRGLLLSSDYLVSNKFHFFLYLCTVEIAPLAIAARIITDL